MRHDRERLCDSSRNLNCLPNTFSISIATIRVKTWRLALRQHEISDAFTMMTRWLVSFVVTGKGEISTGWCGVFISLHLIYIGPVYCLLHHLLISLPHACHMLSIIPSVDARNDIWRVVQIVTSGLKKTSDYVSFPIETYFASILQMNSLCSALNIITRTDLLYMRYSTHTGTFPMLAAQRMTRLHVHLLCLSELVFPYARGSDLTITVRVWSVDGMIPAGWNRSALKKKLVSLSLSTINPTCIDLRLNWSFRG